MSASTSSATKRCGCDQPLATVIVASAGVIRRVIAGAPVLLASAVVVLVPGALVVLASPVLVLVLVAGGSIVDAPVVGSASLVLASLAAARARVARARARGAGAAAGRRVRGGRGAGGEQQADQAATFHDRRP
jgi:hypothetical protein